MEHKAWNSSSGCLKPYQRTRSTSDFSGSVTRTSIHPNIRAVGAGQTMKVHPMLIVTAEPTPITAVPERTQLARAPPTGTPLSASSPEGTYDLPSAVEAASDALS
ncbi:hypothetical protein Nepgr_009629 [Nepenthes gracilis]|uniref:Uncharacterized protein n=1 Tax=Nepenthes gracilis TaxID=150966 RepID=A0AAD3SBR8_NEPGR|nr:hypothetical protein Nepgr_009629 [Nepenthes gracilis]